MFLERNPSTSLINLFQTYVEIDKTKVWTAKLLLTCQMDVFPFVVFFFGGGEGEENH